MDENKCTKCGGKGFRESYDLRSSGQPGVLLQCCDIAKYSDEVAKRLSEGVGDNRKTEYTNNVYPLPTKKSGPQCVEE